MQSLKIDVKKIDKTALYQGEKGTYLDLTLMENRDGTDQYGYDGFIVQSISKERRLAGEKGPILGNWKHLGERAPAYQGQAATKPVPVSPVVASDVDDDIPF
jgi:hypothetical protein